MLAERSCPFCGQDIAIPAYLRNGQDIAHGLVILEEVAREHNLTVRILAGKSRQAHIVLARRCAARRLREETTIPLKAIGLLMGGRDHSTIINLLQNIPSTLHC